MQSIPLRLLITTLATGMLAGSALTARADFALNFDNVASGSTANSAVPAGTGVSFFHGVLLPDEDEFGDPIPGTDKWRVDPTAPDVTVNDPDTFGSGSAPSAPNALNALDQPVLTLFNVAFTLQTFSVTLDNDTFGIRDAEILFYDPADVLLRSITIDQSQPGLIATTSDVFNVSKIVLPGGAFYDNLNVTGTAVPEPSTWVLLTAGALATAGWRRMKRPRTPGTS